MKLVVPHNQKLFFTGDTHYAHVNICKAISTWQDKNKTRDFPSVEQMNICLVNSINSLVGKNDILFHLGDWSFGGMQNVIDFRQRLQCKNIYLILGNHDFLIRKNKSKVKNLFTLVDTYVEVTVKLASENGIITSSENFILKHYPIASWNNLSKGSIHLHGHVHSSSESKFGPGKMLDVGVDGNCYFPYEVRNIVSQMSLRPIESLMCQDHHIKTV